MNKDRRARIHKIADDLSGVAGEEREAFENLPEGIQWSERGEAMEENADRLDEIIMELMEIAGGDW